MFCGLYFLNQAALETLFLILICTALLFWGGYQRAKRTPLLGSIAAVILLFGALFLVRLDLGTTTLGDGAPSGAGAFLGFLILLEFICIFLAGTLLVAGWRGSDYPLAKTLFLFLFLPFATYAIYSAIPSQSIPAKKAGMRGDHGNNRSNIQVGSKKDGYVWAIDSEFLSASECKNGTSEFLAGCLEGVAKNLARQAK